MLPKSILTFTGISLLTLGSLYAAKFEPLGYKAISMGGASVASSTGSMATYNNPALLGKNEYTVEVSMGLGVAEQDYGAGASIAELNDLSFMDTLDKAAEDPDSLSASERQDLLEATDILIGMDGDKISLLPQAYLAVQAGNFAIGVFSSTDTLITASVDTDYDQLIFENNDGSYSRIDENGEIVDATESEYNDSSIVLAINEGLTYLDVEGAALAEVPFAYGHDFETRIGDIMVGGALKYMEVITYVDKYNVDGSGEIDSESDVKRDKRSSNFGVDIGLAYRPAFSYDLTLALVGKNLNAPAFDYYDGSKYTIDPLVRAGFAYKVIDSLEIAADIDLTSNKTLNSDLESKMVGGGLNYEPFNNLFALSLRGGLMKNLHKNDKAGLIYTAGLGLGVKWFQIDLSAEVSDNVSTSEGTTVPQYAKVNLALISRW